MVATGRWVAKLSEEEKAEKEAAAAKAAEKGKGKGKDFSKGKAPVDAKGKDKGKGKGFQYDFKGFGKGKDAGKGKDYNKGKGKSDDYSKGAGKGGKSKNEEEDGIGRRTYFNQLKEVFASTSAQASDIDSKAIQLLDELCGKQGKTEELCAYLKESLEAVSREKVSNWSAYFFTLLRKFDPEAYKAMREERGRPKRESRPKKDRSGAPDVKLNVEAPVFVPGQQWAGA